MVDDLMPEVAALRGLAWKRPVKARVMARDQLPAHLQAQLDREYPASERVRDERILHRLGLLEEDENLIDLFKTMYGGMMAGFYEPDSGDLYVIEGPLGDAMKSTIVHELTHALDDQHYDLDGLEEPHEDDPDRFFAGRCLFEGSAVHTQYLYEDANPEIARAALKHRTGADGDAQQQKQVMQQVPAFMIVSSLLHYRVGPHLVGRAAAGAFAPAMQELFANPPTTQEHFLHPERWLDPDTRDLGQRVIWPEAMAKQLGEDWSTYYAHSVGELDLALHIDHFISGRKGRIDPSGLAEGRYVSDKAFEAACGWDAGQRVYLASGKRPLVVLDAYAFDSEQDAKEAHAQLLAVARKRGAAVDEHAWTGAGEGASQAATYSTWHGRGCVVRRGSELLLADGVPPERFEAFIPALLETRFELDPTEAAARVEDPLADCAVHDRRRGLGWRLPNTSWRASRLQGPHGTFAVAQRDDVTVRLVAPDQGMSQAALRAMVEVQWGTTPNFDASKIEVASLSNRRGYRYVAIGRSDRHIEITMVTDGVRSFVAVVQGPGAQVREHYQEVQDLLDGIVSLPGY